MGEIFPYLKHVWLCLQIHLKSRRAPRTERSHLFTLCTDLIIRLGNL